ncbi:hypothetical protein [Devosia sp. CN2-171]|uniref:hypothetical protein n=1 Tax=Devosia sp. CN2-171 TaxID=3400909 RepID=UPI003BF8D5EB
MFISLKSGVCFSKSTISIGANPSRNRIDEDNCSTHDTRHAARRKHPVTGRLPGSWRSNLTEAGCSKYRSVSEVNALAATAGIPATILGKAVAALALLRHKAQVLHSRRTMKMARKPNYDFERRERERLKNEKNAARAEAKQKAATDEAPAKVPNDDADKE